MQYKITPLQQWYEPLDIAYNLEQQCTDYVFLYSAAQRDYSGRYSFIAYDKLEEIFTIQVLQQRLLDNGIRLFGYLGYGVKNQLEKLPQDRPSFIDIPDIYMVLFANFIVFDHQEHTCQLYSLYDKPQCITAWLKHKQTIQYNKPLCSSLFSNMTENSYYAKVRATIAAIARGDFYQANITRKFYGTLQQCTAFTVFVHLCKCNPSPYASLCKLNDYYILSTTPEMFLKITPDGIVETRPIKGSMPRFTDTERDEQAKRALAESSKDRAENLMVVDLMRNDLGRSTHSVTVKELFKIYSYTNIHHMVSTIQAKKLSDISTLQLITNAFPPGSMTGAPKIQAMKWCTYIEKVKRGVYSGTIGWIDSDNSAELAVVIRTLLLQEDKFEFQSGGAITYDSLPIKEHIETLTKIKPIAQVLGIRLT